MKLARSFASVRNSLPGAVGDRRTFFGLARRVASLDDSASYELAGSACRFSSATRKAVEEKLSLSATLLRAGEVTEAGRLLAEVEDEVARQKAALLERVNEVGLERALQRERITRLRTLRMVAVCTLGAGVLVTSALGMAVAGLMGEPSPPAGRPKGRLRSIEAANRRAPPSPEQLGAALGRIGDGSDKRLTREAQHAKDAQPSKKARFSATEGQDPTRSPLKVERRAGEDDAPDRTGDAPGSSWISDEDGSPVTEKNSLDPLEGDDPPQGATPEIPAPSLSEVAPLEDRATAGQ